MASSLARRRGLSLFLCTDTVKQAGERALSQGALYTPSKFDDDWSGASLWVATTWFTRPGPFVLEGLAACRALRKYADVYDTNTPPCDEVVWLRCPRHGATPKHVSTGVGVESIMLEMLDNWPELAAITRQEL